MSGRQTHMHATTMAILGSTASKLSAGTSLQVKSPSFTCRTVTSRPMPMPMSKMPSPKMSVSATLLDRGICNFHTAGIGSVQMVSSIARPHAAMAATMGTCARQVPGLVESQFLE